MAESLRPAQRHIAHRVLFIASGVALVCALATLAVLSTLQPRGSGPAPAWLEIAAVALLGVAALALSWFWRAHHQLQLALAASEARHRAIVEEQSELVALAWPDGELLYANPAYARLLGRTPQQMLGRSLYEDVADADRSAVSRQLAEVLASGISQNGENRMCGPQGERWVAWTNSLQRDPQGRAMLRSVGRDVTARKQAEQALRASQSFLARTGRVARVGGWEYHLANGAMNWSEQTRRTHDVGADYMPTLATALAFFTDEARPVLQRAVDACTERGDAFALELPLTTATGRAIHVLVVGEAETEDGRVVRLVGACQDITERKRLEQSLADSERFLRQLTDSLPVRMAYFDAERRYRFVNQAHTTRFGLPREQIIGHTRSELTHGSSDAVANPAIAHVLRGQPQQFEFDEIVGGQRVRIESRLIPDVGTDGEVRGFFSTGIDITERSAAAQAQQELTQQLHRQAAALQAIIEAIPAMVFVVGRDGLYRYVNRSFERWVGRSREHLIGHSARDVLGDAEYESRRPWVNRVLAGESVSFERDGAAHHSGQHLTISHIPLRLQGGAVDGFIGVSQDITQHKQQEVRLLQLAQRDALTGLLNRPGLEHYLEHRLQDQALADNPADSGSLALLYIDLDFFKPVNDRHGHDVGDQVLQGFGQRLLALVRPSDAVARLGGDEFAIVLAGLRERAHAQAVADKVIAAAAAPFVIQQLTLHIGASVGVAFGTEAAQDWKGLLARADTLLYQAKAAGRGRQAVAADSV